MSGIHADRFTVAVGGKRLLDEVGFDLEPGLTHAFIGEREAGKTVLLRALVGMWPSSAEVSGRLVVDGLEPATIDAADRLAMRRRRLLFVPASGREALNPVIRVGRHFEDVCSVLDDQGKRRSQRKAAIRDSARAALLDLGIADPDRVLASLPDELSGGMRKRVLLSFALLLKPSVLTADDPTGGLDVTIQRQLMDLLASLRRQEGFTLVIATQDLGVVAHYSDTITVLDRGRVVEHTTPMDFFSGPQSETGAAMLARARV